MKEVRLRAVKGLSRGFFFSGYASHAQASSSSQLRRQPVFIISRMSIHEHSGKSINPFAWLPFPWCIAPIAIPLSIEMVIWESRKVLCR